MKWIVDSHKDVNRFNANSIDIRAEGRGDPPNRGDVYQITALASGMSVVATTEIRFQNGDPRMGVNGITDEALLAVVIDRLEKFQTGVTRCRENALAITKLEEAMHWLRHRSADREHRGVEHEELP